MEITYFFLQADPGPNYLVLLTQIVVGVSILIIILKSINKRRNKGIVQNLGSSFDKLNKKNARGFEIEKEAEKQTNSYSKATLDSNSQYFENEEIQQQSKQTINYKELFELKDLVSENKIDSAIGKLSDLIKEDINKHHLYNELVILKSRYLEFESTARKGTLSSLEENTELNKIRDILLRIIDSLN